MDIQYCVVSSAQAASSVRPGGGTRAALSLVLVTLLLPVISGCQLGWDTLDISTVRGARSGFQDYYESYPLREEDYAEAEEEKPGVGSVIVGQLLSIFPGMFVHGLGHYYAGDYETATRLRHVGEVGYISLAIGGGLVVGGYFLDQEDDLVQGYAYGMYGAGGFIGAVGIVVLFLMWVVQGMRVALRASDYFTCVAAAGMTLVVGVSAFVNFLVVLGLAPTKGLALPFISYGGTSLVVNLTAIGILLNISSQCSMNRTS